MAKRGSPTIFAAPPGPQMGRWLYGTQKSNGQSSVVATADADPAVSYLYAGLAWIIEAACAEPGVRLTQHNLGGMTIGDGGDQYVGVDRFGQLEELRWHRISSPTTWLEHLTFGYDKSGSRLWRENLLFGNTEDELYAYDGLYQLLLRQRGNLTNDKLAIAGTPQREEALAFDPLGNWTGYNAKAGGTAFLTQSRTHNQANQITALGNSVPAVTPLGVSHDAAGNIVQAPPDPAGDWTKGFKLTWDAWNRIVKVRKANDNSEVATFQYDALFRRTIRHVGSTDHHEYWDSAWQLVEERLDASAQPHFQYLWGLNGHNDLVRRDDTTTAGGDGSFSSGSSPSSRLYVLSDGMSPTAILDRSGTLLERQSFSAFGLRRLLAPNGSDRATSVLSDWRCAFHGQFYDSETGFANYGFRYYSPQLGRWFSRDPISIEGGLNIYAHLENNPINIIDGLGLRPYTLPDGRTIDFDSLPPELQNAIYDYEREKQKLEDLEQQMKELEAYKEAIESGTNSSVRKVGEPTVGSPVFESEKQKCLYECMESKGAIKAGTAGVVLGGGGMVLGTYPKTPEELRYSQKINNKTTDTTLLHRFQKNLNKGRQSARKKPIKSLGKVGKMTSGAGNVSRYASIVLNVYTLAMFAYCYCECSKKLAIK